MAVSLTLRPEQIARAECILADGLESIQAVKKRTGADILFNWPIYDFDGGTIRSRFCLFGHCLGDYSSWGVAFGADGKPFWDYDGESGAPCFAGEAMKSPPPKQEREGHCIPLHRLNAC